MSKFFGLLGRHSGPRAYGVAAATVLVAIGGIVLMRSAQAAAPEPLSIFRTPPAGPGPVRTDFTSPLLSGSAALSQSAIVQAGGAQSVMAEINLTAAQPAGIAGQRRPVAIAIVLDTSGSMAGEKIEQARHSVRQLIGRMQPQDQVAIVAYNNFVQVLQPLAPVAQVRWSLESILARVMAGGGTMIPPAINQGAAQLMGASEGHARRVVLVSDGLDGSNIPLPVLSGSIRSYAQQGLAVSSLGIGVDYDERFLTSVADSGNGNYEFLSTGAELEHFLTRELNQASRTLVDQVAAVLSLPAGWRVGQVFGSDWQATGSEIVLPVGSMYGGEERRLVVELQVDPAMAALSSESMQVRVNYLASATGEPQHLDAGALALRAVATPQLADASRDPAVYATSTAVAVDQSQADAVEAWRQGDAERAQRISQGNARRLRELRQVAPAEAAPVIEEQIEAAEADEGNFGSLAPSSEAGRAYGLQSNAARRSRGR